MAANATKGRFQDQLAQIPVRLQQRRPAPAQQPGAKRGDNPHQQRRQAEHGGGVQQGRQAAEDKRDHQPPSPRPSASKASTKAVKTTERRCRMVARRIRSARRTKN
jgi:hypothetical protein